MEYKDIDIPDENSDSDEFLRLLLSNQTRIYAYILSLVGNYNDADDIMQETTSLMWRKFAQFTKGTEFVAWGIQFAHYRILNYRERKKRDAKLVFEDELFDQLAGSVKDKGKYADEQMEGLRNCVQKLKERDRNIVELRYYKGVRPREISTRLGLSIHNVYKLLARIHGQLLDCVKRSLSRSNV